MTHQSMTIEATITRTLGIRFIDARELAVSAKLNLSITGYPNEEQHAALIEEATRIFYNDVTWVKRTQMQSDRAEFLSTKENGQSTESSSLCSSERSKPCSTVSGSTATKGMSTSLSLVSTNRDPMEEEKSKASRHSIRKNEEIIARLRSGKKLSIDRGTRAGRPAMRILKTTTAKSA